MDNPKLSIIIPTYNERESVKILIPEIEIIFKDIKHEIIVVDDNSPDKTGELALDFNKVYRNIRLLRRFKKEGVGAALKSGYDIADGEIILSSDADLSFSAKEMLTLFRYVDIEGYDLVVGCRHKTKGSHYELKGLRTTIKGMISRLGNTVLSSLSDMPIHDFSANFRAIKKQAWQKLDIKENTNVMLFEMIIKAKYNHMRITEVPVVFKERLYGKSKLSLSKDIPKFFLRMIYYIFKYR